MIARHDDLEPSLTPLLGRDADLARMVELLAQGERLVTLTGGAGFGKTRLARALGRRMAESGRWSGGVWFVALPRQGPTRALPVAVAAAVSLGPGPDDGAPERLGRRLRALGPTLLLLDDLAPVTALTRRALAIWLATAPEMAVVAISRETLGVHGEVRHVLGPLASVDAMRLLTQRAEAVNAGCSGLPGWEWAATELVRHLDENPLAIELAAARMAVLSPQALLARLGDRFMVLGRGPGGPERGLWDALSDSWEALSGRERSALAQLSAFRGPASLSAIEHVLDLASGPAADDEPPLAALAAIESLVHKSLVVAAPPGADREPRFSLYASVRDFARMHLSRDPASERAVHARLAAWFDAVATRCQAELRTPAAARARQTLLDELEDLLTVAELGRDRAAAARILVAVESVVRRIGLSSRWLALLARLGPELTALPAALRSSLHVSHGTLLARRGEADAAARAFAAAVAAAQQADDLGLEGVARARSVALLHFGGLDALLAELRLAVELLTNAGSDWDLAAARAGLAVVLVTRGEHPAAHQEFADAIEAMRRGRMTGLLGPALNNLGFLYGSQGDWSAAFGTFREALAAAVDDQDRMLECVVRRNLGECLLREGDEPGAEGLFAAARAIAGEVGDVRIQGVATAFLAAIALLGGDPARAAALCGEARDRLAQAWSDPVAEGLMYCVLALAEARLGQGALAEATLAHARALLDAADDVMLARAHAIYRLHLTLLRGATTPAAARDQADAITAAAEQELHGVAGPSRLHQVLFARRLLEASAATPGLTVAADGSFFVTAAGERVSLARKASARRVLARLAAERATGSSRPLDVAVLFDAGWPGDKVSEPYRTNRVYVLVAKLRGAGLGLALLHDGDGYRLDPAVTIAPVEPGGASG